MLGSTIFSLMDSKTMRLGGIIALASDRHLTALFKWQRWPMKLGLYVTRQPPSIAMPEFSAIWIAQAGKRSRSTNLLFSC
jgi:hypothetical protein